MKPLRFIVMAFACVMTTGIWGQKDKIKTMTLEEAIAMGLENNKRIQVQGIRTEIAAKNVYLGNAGLLPTVNVIGSAQYSENQSDITIRTFQPNPPIVNFDEDGVVSETISAVVQADYQLIGGFAGKYRYRLLKNESEVFQLQQRAIIEETVVNITALFTEIGKLQSREELLLENIAITTKRLVRVEDRKQFGQATGLDVLRAKTDLNQENNALDDVKVIKSNLLKQLNVTIGLPPEEEYRVSVSYELPEEMENEKVLNEIKTGNTAILLANLGIEVAQNQIGLNSSAFLPKLNVFANYGYFNQQNDVQQLAEIENLGFVLGASLRFNVFNGSKTRRDLQSSKLNKEAQELDLKDLEEQTITLGLQELTSLATLGEQLRRETDNLVTFEETFERTQERFFNGQATNIDLNDSQNALLNARISVNDIKLDMVQRLVNLNSLQGKIIPLD
nr:TolC family protein [uncultured Allomuricauda sp.]